MCDAVAGRATLSLFPRPTFVASLNFLGSVQMPRKQQGKVPGQQEANQN